MSNSYELDRQKGLISIIIPVYNVEKYIRKCLDSVVTQTYQNVEIIIVDDGTPDDSGNICEEYAKTDKRIKVLHKENGGLSDARNYGIERATGEYIVFIDSDDFVDSDYIYYLFRLINRYKCKMAICQHRTLYDNGAIKDHGHVGEENIPARDCLERMLYHDIIDTSAWAKIYHYSLFSEVKYPKGKIFEDIGTTYKLMIRCDHIAVGYESKYNYVFHDNSIVNSSFKLNKLDMIDMTDGMARDVIATFPELSNAVKRRQVYARLSTLNQMLNTSGLEDKRKELICFVKHNAKSILINKKAPKRDKIAILLLSISYRTYRLSWLLYQHHIMRKEK